MKDAADLRNLLANYAGGSEQVYVHSLNRRMFYTAGARAFFQNAGGGAYWLLDIFATNLHIIQAASNDFAIAHLAVTEDGKATLTVCRDILTQKSGKLVFEDIVMSEEISITDCPPGEWKFYLAPTQVGETSGFIVMLPNEY